MHRTRERAAGILLAAGSSTRMGRPKQLLSAGGQTLLVRVLEQALRSELHRVVLVLGDRAEEIRQTLGKNLEHPKLTCIENKQYREGISSSIKAGLDVASHYDHAMILLADMPCIHARLINLLLRRYLDSGMPLGAVQVGGKRSHPVIFGKELFRELFTLTGDTGGRNLFKTYKDRVCLVEAEGIYRDMDIDTPEDYENFRKSLEEL